MGKLTRFFLEDGPDGLTSFWANQEIQKLELEERSNWYGEKANKNKIIELSKYGNILHKYTAFIGISDQANESTATADSRNGENFHLSNSLLASLHESTYAVADSVDFGGMDCNYAIADSFDIDDIEFDYAGPSGK